MISAIIVKKTPRDKNINPTIVGKPITDEYLKVTRLTIVTWVE